jgi:pyrroline-5-carboxylate reductase
MSNDKSILRQSKIGIIGAGNMGRALAMGLLKSKVVTKSDLVASDVDVDAAQAFEKVVGVRTVQSNAEVVGFATVLVLAVKPQVMDGVLEDLAKTVKPQQLVMSIAAGISLARLEKFLTQSPLVRIMPNTPALVGMGISAVCANALANPTHRAIACAIMEAVGDVIAVDETSMDAVTATSGSGPAYVFYFMEALMEGAMRQGLDAKLKDL